MARILPGRTTGQPSRTGPVRARPWPAVSAARASVARAMAVAVSGAYSPSEASGTHVPSSSRTAKSGTPPTWTSPSRILVTLPWNGLPSRCVQPDDRGARLPGLDPRQPATLQLLPVAHGPPDALQLAGRDHHHAVLVAEDQVGRRDHEPAARDADPGPAAARLVRPGGA